MNKILKNDLTVFTSLCDSSAQMGIPNTLSIFMDMATQHANELQIGSDKLGEKGLIWVASKTRAVFFKRPKFMQTVTAATWPEKPEKIRFNRHYAITDGDELLVAGKTEWAIVDKESGRPQRADGIYPEMLEYCTDTPIEEGFSRISADFKDGKLLESYKIKFTDIDLYKHMNNVAYVNAIMGAFSSKELYAMNIKAFEISYRIPCFEGEILDIYSRNTEDAVELGMIKADGKAAALARIEIEKIII